MPVVCDFPRLDPQDIRGDEIDGLPRTVQLAEDAGEVPREAEI